MSIDPEAPGASDYGDDDILPPPARRAPARSPPAAAFAAPSPSAPASAQRTCPAGVAPPGSSPVHPVRPSKPSGARPAPKSAKISSYLAPGRSSASSPPAVTAPAPPALPLPASPVGAPSSSPSSALVPVVSAPGGLPDFGDLLAAMQAQLLPLLTSAMQSALAPVQSVLAQYQADRRLRESADAVAALRTQCADLQLSLRATLRQPPDAAKRPRSHSADASSSSSEGSEPLMNGGPTPVEESRRRSGKSGRNSPPNV